MGAWGKGIAGVRWYGKIEGNTGQKAGKQWKKGTSEAGKEKGVRSQRGQQG